MKHKCIISKLLNILKADESVSKIFEIRHLKIHCKEVLFHVHILSMIYAQNHSNEMKAQWPKHFECHWQMMGSFD